MSMSTSVSMVMIMNLFMSMFMIKFMGMDAITNMATDTDTDTVTDTDSDMNRDMDRDMDRDTDKDRDKDRDTNNLDVKKAIKSRSNLAGCHTPLNKLLWVSKPSWLVSKVSKHLNKFPWDMITLQIKFSLESAAGEQLLNSNVSMNLELELYKHFGYCSESK